MCGIAGIISDDLNENTMKKIIESFHNRGPDEAGIFSYKNFHCGHKRLKIIDIKTGQQPMISFNKDKIIVFNGEIYNFKALRKELESKGYLFKTNCDTEVLLNMYLEYKENCLEKLDGMFAFAIYTISTEELFIARDRLGIKPLFYSISNQTIVFGSTIKAILLSKKTKTSVNYKVLSNYLSYFRSYVGNETLYKNIFTLEPGYYLKFKKGNIFLKKWWQLPIVPEMEKIDQGEKYYCEKIRSLLKNAVSERMISDVPLGAYLSGGVDSSILVSIMSELTNKQIKTFSIGFEEKGFNEFEYSDIISKKFNTDHHKIIMDPDEYMPTLQALIEKNDNPLTVPNEIPLAKLSNELKKEITVVLSGEGSDELFAGYDLLFRAPIDLQRFKALCNCPDMLSLNKKYKFIKNLSQLYSNNDLTNIVDHHFSLYSWIPENEKELIIKPDILYEMKKNNELKNYYNKYFSNIDKLSHYDKILYFFEQNHLNALLTRLDNATMYNSVEGRVPFVDHKLVEFVFSMPFHYKLRNKYTLESMITENSYSISQHDTGKYILRQAYRGKIPENVLNRKKFSFPVPLDTFFSGKLKNEMMEILHDRSSAGELINIDIVDKWIKSINPPKGLKIWQLMNAILWYKLNSSFFQ